MAAIENSSVGKANALLGLQFLSDFGDQITTALLALCVLDITKSTGKVGLVYFINILGFVVFTLAGSYLGDRLSKKNILFCSDIGRGLVVLLMILALREKSITLVYITSFFLSVLGSLHRPVKLSIWAKSIPSNRLERYNSFSEFSTQTNIILGPLIASFFITNQLTNFGLSLDALSFFICAMVFAAIITERGNTNLQACDKRNFFRGFALIAQNQEMLRFVSYDAIQMIGFGAFNATFFILAQRDFGWTKVEYSYHLSIIAAFALLGASLGTMKFMASISATTKLVSCAILSAFALWAVLYVRTFPLGSLLFGVCHTLTVVTMVVTRTKVQLLAKNDHHDFLSSVLASRSIIIKAATLVGTGTCLILDDFLSLEMILALYAIPICFGFLHFVVGRKQPALAGTMLPERTIIN